jgi:hypothetical protein
MQMERSPWKITGDLSKNRFNDSMGAEPRLKGVEKSMVQQFFSLSHIPNSIRLPLVRDVNTFLEDATQARYIN